MALTLEQVTDDNDSYLCPAVTIFYKVLNRVLDTQVLDLIECQGNTRLHDDTLVMIIQIQIVQNICMFPENIFYTQLIHICILIHKFPFEYNSMFLKSEPQRSIR